MKSAHLQTAALVAVAMIFGGGATYFFVGKSKKQVTTLASIAAPPSVPLTPAPEPEQSPIAQFSTQFDGELDAAIAAARAARAAGTYKPLAKTPDEFAHALGKINFRLHEFSARYDEPPGTEDTAFTKYSAELKQLTDDLANLLSDDSLMTQIEDSDPQSLAHHQALLASGALDLDAATTAKIEAIIASANAKALPEGLGDREMTPEEEAEFDKRFDAMTADIEAQIRPLLSAGQLKRLDELGAEQVLFGLAAD